MTAPGTAWQLYVDISFLIYSNVMFFKFFRIPEGLICIIFCFLNFDLGLRGV